MGISFKISEKGRRFKAKPSIQSQNSIDNVKDNLNSKESFEVRQLETANQGADENLGKVSRCPATVVSAGHEVSFTLSLYPKGYSIGKQLENESAPSAFQDIPKLLHPYDRASESLFSAIEAGKLPADFFEDIPCKYDEGTLVCEVRDYRNCASGQDSPSACGYPVVNRVCLEMSLENVVKDIPLMSDQSWTYGDLMEVESRILKALQPKLHLDPTPQLDRLCEQSISSKLNLSVSNMRRKRRRQMSEASMTSNSEKVRPPEGPDPGSTLSHLIPQQAHDNTIVQNHGSNMLAFRHNGFGQNASVSALPTISHQQRYQVGAGNSRSMPEQGSCPVVASSGMPLISYAEQTNLNGKRNNQDGQMSPMSSLGKRARPSPVGSDLIQQQIGQQREGVHGPDMNRRVALLQQAAKLRGVNYGNLGNQRFSPQLLEGATSHESASMQMAGAHQGMRFGAKQEQLELEKLDSTCKNELQLADTCSNHLDPQSQFQTRGAQHGVMRSNLHQTQWNTVGQHIEKDGRREDQLQRRKLAQSPHMSSGALPQSPLSSISGELSSGSMGPQFGAIAASQKEKSSVSSVPGIGGIASFNSGSNDSLHRQHQAQVAAKRRSSSLPKSPAITGAMSPAGSCHMGGQLNAHSPSVPPMADQAVLDRFSKIDMVTRKHCLNTKKTKVDEYHRQHRGYSPQRLTASFANIANNEDFKNDSKPLSKSLVGGTMNTCKTRSLNFLRVERILQGNVPSPAPRIRLRMLMSERPTDGTVAWHYGDMDDGDIPTEDDYLSTLPSAHMADLLAAQLSSLMVREGYAMMEDHLQAKPSRNTTPNIQQGNSNAFSNNPAPDMQQQYADAAEVGKPVHGVNIPANPSSNILPHTRMSPPANSQALQTSQGLISGVSMPLRPQQLDPQIHSPLSQPQQNQQYQRPPMMFPPNTVSQLNAVGQGSGTQLGNQMVNKASSLHLQQLLRQQPQQTQQQGQMPRKVLMGLGTAMGMGNMGNNMAGLGGLANSMGIRGMPGAGISAPMASLSGISTMNQNPVNLNTGSNLNAISQQFRSGLPHVQANMMARFRMNRPGVQSGLAAMSGARQMHPGSAGLSMFGQNAMNRANMAQVPQGAMNSMGPPKLLPGMSPYVNLQSMQLQPQQQQLQQPQQQQLQQLQQQSSHQQGQHQPQLPQHDSASSLQAMLSPPMGSPSTMVVPQMNQAQQQLQPHPSSQQASQRTPISPQMSAGEVHPVSAGNPETCPPASPQLSSQTLGSVGSISNSPMELQGVNKSNSAGNA